LTEIFRVLTWSDFEACGIFVFLKIDLPQLRLLHQNPPLIPNDKKENISHAQFENANYINNWTKILAKNNNKGNSLYSVLGGLWKMRSRRHTNINMWQTAILMRAWYIIRKMLVIDMMRAIINTIIIRVARVLLLLLLKVLMLMLLLLCMWVLHVGVVMRHIRTDRHIRYGIGLW
jgi:hypothetical protein